MKSGSITNQQTAKQILFLIAIVIRNRRLISEFLERLFKGERTRPQLFHERCDESKGFS